MALVDYIPFLGNDRYEDLGPALRKVQGEHDAVILFPYDDGTFFPKPADFDKELLGGKGGYETIDGDKIVLDGAGEPKKNLFGVPMLLACDPTEHAAAVEPMKAHIAHKKDLGQWLMVDRRGNVLEAGEAMVQATDDEDELQDIGLEGTMVQEHAQERGISMDRALEELQAAGDVTKVYDFSTPAAPVATDGGEVEIEEATHVAVDQSKAADLLPRTMSTEEINVALDKARMEEHDEGKIKDLITYGVVLGVIVTILAAIVLGGMFFLVG